MNNSASTCSFCGAEIPAGAQTCPLCGAPVDENKAASQPTLLSGRPPEIPQQPDAEPQAAEPQEPIPPSEEPIFSQAAPPPPPPSPSFVPPTPSKNNRWIWIVVAALIVLCLCCFACAALTLIFNAQRTNNNYQNLPAQIPPAVQIQPGLPSAPSLPESVDSGLVNVVYLYYDGCQPCQQASQGVIQEIKAKYSQQIKVLAIDVKQAGGQELWDAAAQVYGVPPVVPMIIIGDTAITPADDLGQRLPELIRQGIENGGVDWPSLPELQQFIPGR